MIYMVAISSEERTFSVNNLYGVHNARTHDYFILTFVTLWYLYLVLCGHADMISDLLLSMVDLSARAITSFSNFTITVEINLPRMDMLDVTFDLPSGKYWPYRKPNNEPLYIHSKSNHPPSILKHLPKNINDRLSSICDMWWSRVRQSKTCIRAGTKE